MLNELKAFTPYAVPFTNRVSRKDVPDYYEVIKKPMDLSTMLRKLKAMVYNSRREFLADLNRIYNNCFTYNTDPGSMLRVHVTMLRDKWVRLLAEVPEIEIRTVAVAPSDQASLSSSQSFSSLNSSVSHLTPLGSRRNDSFTQTMHDLDTQAAQTPAPVEQRSAARMAAYHRARLRLLRHPRRKAREPFYPELVFDQQLFPDGLTVLLRPPPRPRVQLVPAVQATMELWKRLKDPDAMEAALDIQRPCFDSDCRLYLDRNIKAVLGHLLACLGFDACRTDALNLLRDALLHRVAELAGRLLAHVNADPVHRLAAVRRALFEEPSQGLRLRLYAANFFAGRQARLSQALEAVGRHRAEQQERAQHPPASLAPPVPDEEPLSDFDDVDEDDLQGPVAGDLDLFGLKGHAQTAADPMAALFMDTD